MNRGRERGGKSFLNIRFRPPPKKTCRLAFLSFSTDAFSRLRPPFKYIPPPGSEKVSARRRVLAQWRGVDLAPLEAAQAVRARRVSDVLPWVTKDLHMDRRRAEAEVVKVWNSLIDPNIIAHAQPVGVRKGTLFVTVDSSVWLSEIVRYRRKEILDRLQHSFGRELIQRISFRVG
jgi:predicted nucleic acid-binding Zn ribbon protein